MDCTADLVISSAWSAGIVLILYLFYSALAGMWSPLWLALAADNRPSTSEIQFWL